MHSYHHGRGLGRVRLWSFRDDVLIEPDPEAERIVVATRWGDVNVDDPGGHLVKPLSRMTLGPVSIANMGVTTDEGSLGHRFTSVIELLAASVVHSLGLEDGSGPVVSAAPIARTASFRLPEFDFSDPIRLSRFTSMRTTGESLVLESPQSSYRVILEQHLAACVVGKLGKATTVHEISHRLGLDEPVVLDLVAYLIASNMVLLGERRGAEVAFAENDDPRLIPWSHHDLLFHSRSRLGLHDDPLGATYEIAHRIPPPPVVKPAVEGQRYPLYRPDLSALAAGDRTLTDVLETPALAGENRAPSDRQIGELLFRAARVRSIRQVTGGGRTYTISDRPYPSIGGSYDLELYLATSGCRDLPNGLHHYDPVDHSLTLLDTSESELGELLNTTPIDAHPSALLIITTRLARLSWVYSGVAYATALKHVGVLQQTLHLVATAMGLRSRALPVGDGCSVHRAFWLNWPEEVGVGEVVISAQHERATR